MVEPISLQPKTDPDLTLAGLRQRSGTSLPIDLLKDISRRLQFICLLVLGLILLNAVFSEITGLEANRVVRYGGLSVAILVSLAVYFLARSGKVTAGRLLDLGMGYEVALAAVFAVSSVELTWFSSVRFGFNFSPIAVWILIFPVVVPNTAQKTLVAAILAALTEPIAVLCLVAAGVGELPAFGEFARNMWPNAAAVFIAVAISKLVYGLGEEVSRARAMGSYELTELLGRGGMGEVWQGKHRLLTRDAAVKLIHPRALGAQDEAHATTVLKRFEREAQATAALRSPHTIEVYDFGIARDGTFYYVMEMLHGLDLQQLVDQFGAQPPGRVVHILKQACHSLHEAHVGGLVHRDIKPSNLFLCRYGLDVDFTKVLDFGIVTQRLDEGTQNPHLTEVGMVSGTPAYLAPEAVVEGVELDGRADIYALGCIGYWLLCGQLVFDKSSPMGFVMAHTNDEPERISSRTTNEIPLDLEDVVMACLAKDPNARPKDALDFARQLGQVASANDWNQEMASEWWAEHEQNIKPG
jgi:hypothetical protein